MNPDDRLLRYSLRGNAAFSTLCGLGAIAAAEPLAGALGLPGAASLTSLAVQLLVFAGLLIWLASRQPIRLGLALAVVATDVLWVVGTVPVLLSGELTTAGNWTAFAIANVVGLFALLQFLGIRRARGAGPLPA